MIEKLKERLNERISEIAYQLDLLVRKDTFETAIADLDERKADRADLDALRAELEDKLNNLDIPAPVVQQAPIEVPAAYDGVILTQNMVDRWDAMAAELAKLKSQIDVLSGRKTPEIPQDNTEAINQLAARIIALEEADDAKNARLNEHHDRLTKLEEMQADYAKQTDVDNLNECVKQLQQDTQEHSIDIKRLTDELAALSKIVKAIDAPS